MEELNQKRFINFIPLIPPCHLPAIFWGGKGAGGLLQHSQKLDWDFDPDYPTVSKTFSIACKLQEPLPVIHYMTGWPPLTRGTFSIHFFDCFNFRK
jgi:hypothetical protein